MVLYVQHQIENLLSKQMHCSPFISVPTKNYTFIAYILPTKL